MYSAAKAIMSVKLI